MVQRRRAERANDRLATIHSRAGRMSRCTLDGFSIDRPLEPLGMPDGSYLNERKQQHFLTEARRTVMDYIANPSGWLYLYGPTGAGKSHLAMAVINALVPRGYTALYESAPELFDYVRQGFDGGDAAERFDAIRDVTLLLLDDLGTEQQSAWTREKLFQLIDSRNKRDLPTLITSNLPVGALGEPRIISRISELSTIIWLPVSDHRMQGVR